MHPRVHAQAAEMRDFAESLQEFVVAVKVRVEESRPWAAH